MFSDLRWEAIVRFIEIGEIVDHLCLKFLFINICQTGEKKNSLNMWHRQIVNFFYEIDYFFHEMLFIDTKKKREKNFCDLKWVGTVIFR